MAKKAKTARKAKRSIGGGTSYKNGWETRRRNAKRAAAERTNGNWKPPGGVDQARADHIKELVEHAKMDGERSLLDPQTDNQQSHGNPGRGDIVGGAYAQLAERIIKLARKKGGTDAVQSTIMAMQATAKYEGSFEADKAATKRLIEVQEITADGVVCGFIAEVDHAMRFHRGLPPAMTWLLNSFTVIKIVDALNKAGYSAAGRSSKAVGS